MYLRTLLASIGLLAAASAAPSSAGNKTCPGYAASNVKKTTTGLTADLNLNGKACNLYGTDLDDLVLEVEYQTCESTYQAQTLVTNPSKRADFMSRFTTRPSRFTRFQPPSLSRPRGMLAAPSATPSSPSA